MIFIHRFIFFLLALTSLIATFSTAHAATATYTVYAYNINDEYNYTRINNGCSSVAANCTIREAVEDANRHYDSQTNTPSLILYLAGARSRGVYQLKTNINIYNPISVVAPADDRAVIDGGETRYGIFNLSLNYWNWVQLGNLVLRNGKEGSQELGGAISMPNVTSRVGIGLVINNCLIGNNKHTRIISSFGGGGAIHSSHRNNVLIIINSKITNNVATNLGGGIYFREGYLILRNTTIENNTAGSGDNMFLDNVNAWSDKSNTYINTGDDYAYDQRWTPQSSF